VSKARPKVSSRATTRATTTRTAKTAKPPTQTDADQASLHPGEVIPRFQFRTPGAGFLLKPKDRHDAEALLLRSATQWTYILRNRERWSALPVSAKIQEERARAFLDGLGLDAKALQAFATERVVEVVVPWVRGATGLSARIFPWEFALAGATRDARAGQSLTVMRRLDGMPDAWRAPAKVLYVESTPGKLRDLYSFDTERALVKSNLRPDGDANWKVLLTPTLDGLRDVVTKYKPDVIHLAGFDSHQGLRFVQPTIDTKNARHATPARTERESDEAADGYLLAGPDGSHQAVGADALAGALCPDGHRPVLVSFSLQNSAARIAPAAIAKGALAAIGFQDAFDDNLVELFFGSFYRAWRKADWRLAEGFRNAWETVRGQPGSVLGSGLVLWSACPLLEKPMADAKRAGAPGRRRGVARPPAPSGPAEKAAAWMPGHVPDAKAHDVVSTRIEPVTELNYSLLHNRCPLFQHFTLVNGSADYEDRDVLAPIADIDVHVTLSAGTESATYQRRLSLETTSADLREQIHVPLTSDLLRSVHESINSSLFVEVAWGKVIYRNSHVVRLLPVDQWRDNDKDGQWLPSFVLPRDAAITALVDKAQRYVRVLRDDPSAGFDGYQSLDPRAAEPAAEVDRQVQAIWSTIVHELNLGYINPPPSYSSAMDSQRLRTPSMIVKDRSGTCLDLALMLAACCELIDVYPVIFLLKDHAFPGYWRQDAFQQKFIEVADNVDELQAEEAHKTNVPGAQRVPWWFRDTAYTEIVRQVKLGNLVPLESVWLTEHSGFWDAVDGGKDNLKQRSRFHSMLDIARAREAGVTPLPVGARP
jgi:hypothetical protein